MTIFSSLPLASEVSLAACSQAEFFICMQQKNCCNARAREIAHVAHT